MGQMRVRRTGPWVKISCPFSWVQFNRSVGQLKGLLKVRRKIVPFAAVPTTAGNGSETNPVYPVPVIFGKEDFIRVARRVMP